jgi:hypothetical protein
MVSKFVKNNYNNKCLYEENNKKELIAFQKQCEKFNKFISSMHYKAEKDK